MKIKKLTIKNIGLIADTAIELNKPLIIFYGEIRQGKSTILNAVRWCLGGAFPTDIIRHGQEEAFVEMEFDGGSIRREFYVGKDGATRARSISFVKNGRPVPSPASEIKRFLNPFLLDQDHFKNMGETERKAFFTEILSLDTVALDTEFLDADRKASDLRIKVKSYGVIDTTPVVPIDEAPLRAELKKIKDDHAATLLSWREQSDKATADYNAKCDEVDKKNESIRQANNTYLEKTTQLQDVTEDIKQLEQQIAAKRTDEAGLSAWIGRNGKSPLLDRPERPVPPSMPVTPDVSDKEAKLSQAGAVAVRGDQYKANLKRADEKKADEAAILQHEARKREIKGEKAAKLKSVAESSGIKGLAFDDDGNFLYEGTTAGMLSTSQIMRLSSDLSALYPEGFGISLLDRGESLGKSIFEFVERANAKKETILATIVGERPAVTPEEVGVFVVTNGQVKA